MNEKRIWWSYLGTDYHHWREANRVHSPERPGECSVRQVRTGDLIVHEYRREVVAVSRVEKAPVQFGKDWQAEVTFIDVAQRVKYLGGLDARLREVEPAGGPMHADIGSGEKGGNLYLFNEAALSLVLAETRTLLPAGW